MREVMSLRVLPSRLLVAHARQEAFAPKTWSILGKLGYEILTPEQFENQPHVDNRDSVRPDLRIVDERRLGEIPEIETNGPVPVIVLTGRHGVTGAETRIVGAVKRPAGLHDLYRLLQQVFEDNPRATPRVPTHIRATCRRRGREWIGAVLSLSENGCLLRSPEPVLLGSQLELSFELPRVGPVELWAESAYQLLPDFGLVFSALAPADRDAISAYVADALDAA
jgi:hypothetical protein